MKLDKKKKQVNEIDFKKLEKKYVTKPEILSVICSNCNCEVLVCDECETSVADMDKMFCDDGIFHFCSKQCWCEHKQRRMTKQKIKKSVMKEFVKTFDNPKDVNHFISLATEKAIDEIMEITIEKTTQEIKGDKIL